MKRERGGLQLIHMTLGKLRELEGSMRADPIRYLEDDVLESAQCDIVAVARYHARVFDSQDAGHFSTPRQVFCYADHLGFLASGDSASTARTVAFIRDFFPPEYARFAELLVAMWRHGTVHQLKPYAYSAPLAGSEGSIEVRWLSSNHNRKRERSLNLLVFPMKNRPGAVYLVMNSCQLADDLVSAINRFLGALRRGELDVADCARRLDTISQPRSYKEVGKSMAESVKEQIRVAWTSQGGMLDEQGNVIEEHPRIAGRS
jgi:hypothetical protein